MWLHGKLVYIKCKIFVKNNELYQALILSDLRLSIKIQIFAAYIVVQTINVGIICSNVN